jgi:hypothetical protein
MNETTIVSRAVSVMKAELKSFVVFKHADRFRSGIPDVSVSGNGFTSWWEFKYADPDFDSRGIQELTMLRLDHASYARYVIFCEDKVRQVLIVEPSKIGTWGTEYELRISRFDYGLVAAHIHSIHNTWRD